MLSLKCPQCKFMLPLKYLSPDLARLSIESSVAREIKFDIVVRNFAGKNSRITHFSKQLYIVQVNIKILKNIIIKSLKIYLICKNLMVNVTLDTASSFVLIPPTYFTYKCYPSGTTFKDSVRFSPDLGQGYKNIFDILF